MGVDEERHSVQLAAACSVCGMEAMAIDIGDDGVEVGYCEDHSPDHLKDILTETSNWMAPRGTRRFFRLTKG